MGGEARSACLGVRSGKAKLLLLGCAVGAILLSNDSLFLAQEEILSGLWWQQASQPARADYLTGFLHGAALGHELSLLRVQDSSCASQVINSYGLYQSYLMGTPPLQILTRLQNFYSDKRNHKIPVKQAIFWWLSWIAGAPEEELNELVEHWRARVPAQ